MEDSKQLMDSLDSKFTNKKDDSILKGTPDMNKVDADSRQSLITAITSLIINVPSLLGS